jgi:predicted nucleic acid-binding protein
VILLDTNVISELVRPFPHPSVVAFVGSHAQENVFTAAICEAEIHYGLARLPAGRRRDDLTARIKAFLATGFQARILHFDSACAAVYGEIRSDREAAGKPIAVEDCMIAATARANGAIVATRNVADFQGCGIDIVSPWEPIGPGS